MIVKIRNEIEPSHSYASERTRGLYNVDVEDGARFFMDVDVPVEKDDWQIGVIVGPSGSGKTSIARALIKDGWIDWAGQHDPWNIPIIELLTEMSGTYAKATAALAAVGLGSVPSWLRPYSILSNGEQFRASMAMLLVGADPTREPQGPEDLLPHDYILDEFTSVLDRQVAKVGASAFAKQWRRQPGRRVILITPHYDILDWVEPDWWIDTAEGADEFATDRGVVLPKAGTFSRPVITVDIRETGWRPWNAEFKRHHYLPDAGPMAFATAFTGFVADEPVCFVGLSGMVVGKGKREARFCRFVTKPEWQGAGIGMRFLEELTERELRGEGFIGRPTTSIIHSAHPALAVTLRRSPKWRQISQALHGGRKSASSAGGMGGHMRAVMGFRYYGQAGVEAWERARMQSQ